MNGAPWWVPLGAAGIALVGVVVGQLVSAWVEGRRQRRDVDQRTFEHWRDKRLEIYREFVTHLDSWRYHAFDLAGTPTPVRESRLNELINLCSTEQKGLRKQLQMTYLVGSEPWIDLARQAQSEMTEIYNKILDHVGNERMPAEQRFEYHSSIIRRISELRELARVELRTYS